MKKRIGALVIMLAMLLTLIPMNAYAENKGGALMCQEVGYDDWWRVIVNESNPLLESYLLDGTKASDSTYTNGYWLETAASGNYVWYISGKDVSVAYAPAESTYSVRPVIELLKDDIAY